MVGWWVEIASAADASAAIARIEAKYAATPGVVASFVQTTRSAWGDSVERGTLALMRPGRFRWDFASDGRVYASDGNVLVAWTPSDGTYLRGPAGDAASSPALGLLGSLHAVDELFTVDLVADDAAGVVLALLPRVPDGIVASIRLALSPDLVVRAVDVTDALGNRTEVSLTDVRLGPVPATRFAFPPPPGARVVDAGAM